ncbi:MAG TPA: histidine phosphatase family protein [Actinomycetes bacterium]
MDLLVVRHAESTWNAEHRWAGQWDPGLSARGRRGAAGLTSRQIEARFPGALGRWRRGEVIEPPGSEPMEAFTGRGD